METEVVDYYADRKYSLLGLLERGKQRGIPEHSVRAAMVHCYRKSTEEGKLMHDIDLARYTLNVARDLEGLQYRFDNELVEDKKQKFQTLQKELFKTEMQCHEYRVWMYGSWFIILAVNIIAYLMIGS